MPVRNNFFLLNVVQCFISELNPTKLVIAAPKLIIYDNCCNLMRYCLRRAPLFFSETQFLIDRLHWFNHSA